MPPQQRDSEKNACMAASAHTCKKNDALYDQRENVKKNTQYHVIRSPAYNLSMASKKVLVKLWKNNNINFIHINYISSGYFRKVC